MKGFTQVGDLLSANIVRRLSPKKAVALGTKGYTRVQCLTSANTVTEVLLHEKNYRFMKIFTLVRPHTSVHFVKRLSGEKPVA